MAVDDHVCPTCKRADDSEAISHDDFMRIVEVAESELRTKQDFFQRRTAEIGTYFYDLDDCTLKLDDLVFRIVPIGTFSNPYQSWLWAWANDEFPTVARDASARIKQLYDLTRWEVFASEGIPTSISDAQTLCALAIHILGAHGLYKLPGETLEEPILYLAVMDEVKA